MQDTQRNTQRNQTWFITGAARGIGLSLARQLLARGDNVAATSRTLASLRQAKYWSPVGRVDNVYGDRNLFCACVPLSEYQ